MFDCLDSSTLHYATIILAQSIVDSKMVLDLYHVNDSVITKFYRPVANWPREQQISPKARYQQRHDD